MGKNVRVLVVGLGSIGRRHVRHLRELENVELAALRTNKGTLREGIDIREFYSISDALLFKPHGVIICNPTSLHVETAIPFLEKGCKVLIEKPIDDSPERARILTPYAGQIRIAYCLRFQPLVQSLTNLFEKDPPFKVSFKRSFYLPLWHPYADYRTEYTAKKDLGGGVIRTLSHEIDLACFWLGKPTSVVGVTDRLSFLEIDTDDFAFFTMKMQSGARVNYELDFFAPVNLNEGEGCTALGQYTWKPEGIWFTPYKSQRKELVFTSPEKSIDLMYHLQLKDFIGFLENGRSMNATCQDGISVLEIINHVEQSS